MQQFSLGHGVANLEDAVVGQSDDITGIGLVDRRLALCHELGGRTEAQRLAQANVVVGLVAHELAAANLAEGDTRTVVGVDVGGDFEHETGEFLLFGTHLALLCRRVARTGGYLHEAVEQFLHTEIVERAAEEHRGDGSRTIVVDIE